MKPITIVKNRSDIGAGTRGSDLGVDAIEIAAINQKTASLTPMNTLMFLHITKLFTTRISSK